MRPLNPDGPLGESLQNSLAIRPRWSTLGVCWPGLTGPGMDQAGLGRSTGPASTAGTPTRVVEEWMLRMLKTEQPFSLAFEQNPLPMWVVDRKTMRILEVNEAALRQYGYSHDEFCALSLPNIRPPDDL